MLKANQSNSRRGLIFSLDEPKIRVWVKTWAEIINNAYGRLTFFRRGLEYQANDDNALKYLSGIRTEYLSDEIAERIKTSESEENSVESAC